VTADQKKELGLRFAAVATSGTVASSGLEEVIEGDEIIVGRMKQSDLVLADISVSPRHFMVRRSGGGQTIEDLGSRLGTRLNGKRLVTGHPVPLRKGDEIEAGVFLVIFRGSDRAGEEQSGATGKLVRLARERQAIAEEEPGQPCLRIVNGPRAGHSYPLRNGEEISLGREDDCDLILDDARVSRLHGRVCLASGMVRYTDSGSRNGSRLDGKPVEESVELSNGCVLRLGGIEIVFEDAEAERRELLAVLDTLKIASPPGLLMPGLLVLGGLFGLLFLLLG